jgi:outer membrane receptor protein involved in Fe transport
MPIRRYRACVVAGALLLGISGGLACAGPLDDTVSFSQPAQPLGDALRALAKQSNIQILFDAELVAGQTAGPIAGTLSPRAALEKLLRGTSLEAHEQATGVVVIRRRAPATPAPRAAAPASPDAPVAPRPAAADLSALGEIVVTAQRRAESEFDVPVSISAYDRGALDNLGARNVEDITRTMPGIIVRPGFEGITTVSIRGVSSVVGSATTGIYIDDTPIQVRALGAGGVASSAFPLIFDLDRVEVLRGPQGTLFGSGSEGGTLRFITPTPSMSDSSVYARSEIGYTDRGDPSYELGVAVGAPLVTDSAGFRVSVYGRNDGGWVDREPYPGDVITSRNTNADDAVVANAAFTFKLTPDVTVTPALYYQRQHSQDVSQYWPPLSNPSAGDFVSGQLLAQPTTEQLVLPSVKIQWDAGPVTLYSNTSFIDHTRDVTGDYSFIDTEVLTGSYTNPRVPSPTAFQNPQEAFTQELRVQSADAGSRLTWLLGAFYQDARQEASQIVYAPGLGQITQALFGLTVPETFGVPLYQGTIAYEGLDSSRDTQTALFGDATLHFSPEWTADVGLRAARTQYSFTNVQYGPFNGGMTGGNGGASETPVSPKLGINYKPDANWLVYGSAAKGFRTGGANTPVSASVCANDLAALGLTRAPATYNSDSTWSYELGSKFKTDNNRLLVDGSVFYVDWKNIQSLVPLLHCGFQYVGNLGNAVTKGFDLQGSVAVLDGLVMHFGLGYTDAAYSGNLFVAPGVPLVTDGDRLDTPPWHVSVAADYSFVAVADAPRGYFHVQYDYDSGYDLQHASDATYDPLANHTWSTHLMSLRLGMKPGSWDTSLFVNNVLNSYDRTSFFHDVPTSPLVRYSAFRPRTIGITVSYRH